MPEDLIKGLDPGKRRSRRFELVDLNRVYERGGGACWMPEPSGAKPMQ